MSLFKNAKLILTPNGYKTGKIFTLKPFDGSDFDVVRATKATRVNADGLIVEENNHIIRLDYTENSCPCILVEEQRTNLLLHSEEFDNAYWLKLTLGDGLSPIVTPNAGVSPIGDNTADRVQLDSNGLGINDRSIIRSTTTNVGLDDYLVSAYVKSYDNSTQFVNLSLFGASILLCQVDSEWKRFMTSINNYMGNINLQLDVRGAGEADVLIWGAQLEQGTEPSSYIPTTSSTVTRNADIATVTPPAGTTQIIETFEDNSNNIITSIPSTYQLPVGRIKHIVML